MIGALNDRGLHCSRRFCVTLALAVLCRRQSDDDMDDLFTSDPSAWFGGICHPSLKESAEIFSAGEMM